VDRLIAWWRARREGKTLPPPEPSVMANLALRLIQIHFCIIYLASGLSKLQGTSWWNGNALWGTMANPEFNPVHLRWYQDYLVFLCKHRWLWEMVTTGGVAYTLALEIGLPFLIWNRRLRWVMILAAVLLHVGIAFTMGLMTFGMMMLSMLASFLPPEAIHRVVATVQETGQNWLGRTAPSPAPKAA
jgi:hypothetical protein